MTSDPRCLDLRAMDGIPLTQDQEKKLLEITRCLQALALLGVWGDLEHVQRRNACYADPAAKAALGIAQDIIVRKAFHGHDVEHAIVMELHASACVACGSGVAAVSDIKGPYAPS